jgi:hypothetical protein
VTRVRACALTRGWKLDVRSARRRLRIIASA